MIQERYIEDFNCVDDFLFFNLGDIYICIYYVILYIYGIFKIFQNVYRILGADRIF